MKSQIKSIIVDLIRRWGIKMILKEIVDVLRSAKDENDRALGRDIARAVEEYERRTGK